MASSPQLERDGRRRPTERPGDRLNRKAVGLQLAIPIPFVGG